MCVKLKYRNKNYRIFFWLWLNQCFEYSRNNSFLALALPLTRSYQEPEIKLDPINSSLVETQPSPHSLKIFFSVISCHLLHGYLLEIFDTNSIHGQSLEKEVDKWVVSHIWNGSLMLISPFLWKGNARLVAQAEQAHQLNFQFPVNLVFMGIPTQSIYFYIT